MHLLADRVGRRVRRHAPGARSGGTPARAARARRRAAGASDGHRGAARAARGRAGPGLSAGRARGRASGRAANRRAQRRRCRDRPRRPPAPPFAAPLPACAAGARLSRRSRPPCVLARARGRGSAVDPAPPPEQRVNETMPRTTGTTRTTRPRALPIATPRCSMGDTSPSRSFTPWCRSILVPATRLGNTPSIQAHKGPCAAKLGPT